MDASAWETAAKVAGAIAPLLLGIITLSRAPGRRRQALKDYSETVKNLPEKSQARSRLLEIIEGEVAALHARSTQRRDWSAFGLAIIGAPLLGLLAVSLFLQDSNWWKALGAFPAGLSLVFTYGVFESLQLADRDEKGRRLKANRSRDSEDPLDESTS